MITEYTLFKNVDAWMAWLDTDIYARLPQPEGNLMALSTDGNTLSEPFKSAWKRACPDLKTEAGAPDDEAQSKFALFLSFYDTLQQSSSNKCEAIAYAAAQLSTRLMAGETGFYGVDLCVMVRECGTLARDVVATDEKAK